AYYDGLDRRTLRVRNNVIKIQIHELWDTETLDYDYCVLTLQDDIVQSPTVQTIELATSAPTQGTTAQLTGWGRTSGTSSTIPYLLQYTIMDIVSWEVCNNIWEPTGQTVTDRMICASNPSAGGCSGDTGGPLVADGRLVGILSWNGKKCPANTVEWPNWYSDVANQWQWLSDHITK
ncbi:unnamed protein product, partial [Medioppia subpectinata]